MVLKNRTHFAARQKSVRKRVKNPKLFLMIFVGFWRSQNGSLFGIKPRGSALIWRFQNGARGRVARRHQKAHLKMMDTYRTSAQKPHPFPGTPKSVRKRVKNPKVFPLIFAGF